MFLEIFGGIVLINLLFLQQTYAPLPYQRGVYGIILKSSLREVVDLEVDVLGLFS
jgi:hypothetical protein